jgi:hypothetical protein
MLTARRSFDCRPNNPSCRPNNHSGRPNDPSPVGLTSPYQQIMTDIARRTKARQTGNDIASIITKPKKWGIAQWIRHKPRRPSFS